MKWINAEQEFESWFSGKSHFVYKFEDARAVMGALQSRKVIVQGRPADYLITSNGTTFFAEIKRSEHPTSFALSNIQKSQWNAAIKTVAAGGLYFFYILNETPVARNWYVVSSQVFIEAINAGEKSIKWSRLEKCILMR